MLLIRIRKYCHKVFRGREMNRVVEPRVRSDAPTKPTRTPVYFAKQLHL